MSFLGHKLIPGGILPGEIKTQAIINFPKPSNVTEIRRFLGLTGYFRKFVPGHAIISEPLRQLLKKNVKFQWKAEQENAFCKLKTALTKTPVLVSYDVNAEHQVHTDASSVGIAAVLMQKFDDSWKPVAFYSRSTSPNECKWHSYELETLAVVEALERFKYYIYGKTITVITDCSAVKAAMSKTELVPRIARWWLRVQDYAINLEHRAGQRMIHVDALSRAPTEEPHELEPASLKINKVDLDEGDWLFSMQLQDAHIKEIINKITEKDKQTTKEFVIDKGRLYKHINDKKLWVVPKTLRFKVTQDAHDKAGHLSVDRTIEKIRQQMWFPRMRNFVKSYVKSCVPCAFNKHPGGQKEGEYHFTDIDPIPFKTVHIDHMGPFPKSSKRNEHVFVLTDAFTKYSIIRAVPSTATKYVLKILDEVSACFGLPHRIVSDRGTSFTSKDFRQYCTNNIIQHILVAVRTPRANGQVERMNRTILSMLLPSTENSRKWDEELRIIQWSINSLKNASTGQSPHQLLFGFQPRDILGNTLALLVSNDDQLCDEEFNIENIRMEAVQQIAKTRQKAKERFDEKHAKPKTYDVGDLVLIGNEAQATGSSRKLEPPWKGPFIITKVLENDRYVVEDLPHSKRKQRHYCSVYASDGIKPWCTLPPDAEIEDDYDIEVDVMPGEADCKPDGNPHL